MRTVIVLEIEYVEIGSIYFSRIFCANRGVI